MPESPSLVDAFLDARCFANTMPTAERKQAAATIQVLYAEIERLSFSVFKRFKLISDAREDVVAALAMKLAETGPRRGQENQPSTEARVRGYLRNALRNRALDVVRKMKHTLGTHASLDATVGETGQLGHERIAHPDARDVEETAIDREEAEERQALVDGVNAWLDDQTLTLVAAKDASRKNAGQNLARTLAQLASAAAGETTVDQLVATACGDLSDPKALKKQRNTFDARFKRARRTLDDWITVALEQQPELDPELVRVLLRRRVSLQ